MNPRNIIVVDCPEEKEKREPVVDNIQDQPNLAN